MGTDFELGHNYQSFVSAFKAKSNNKAVFEIFVRETYLHSLEISDSSTNLITFVENVIQGVQDDICTNTLPFVLLQDTFDILNKELCGDIFGFIENKLPLWKNEPYYSAGKNYLLRMCNGLLKRLSPSQDTLLCGRIQIFLAKLFPISDRSGLNLNGQFNLENVTHYETEQEFEQLKQHTSFLNQHNQDFSHDYPDDIKQKIESYQFYSDFWSLQKVFRDPITCFDSTVWDSFIKKVDEVLTIFAVIKTAKIKLQTAMLLQSSPSKKGRQPSENNINSSSKKLSNLTLSFPNNNPSSKVSGRRDLKTEQLRRLELKNAIASSLALKTTNNLSPLFLNNDANTFFAKYLTGSNLFKMQLEDNEFRTTIIVQCLLTLTFLTCESRFKTGQQSLTPEQKSKCQALQKTLFNLLDENMLNTINNSNNSTFNTPGCQKQPSISTMPAGSKYIASGTTSSYLPRLTAPILNGSITPVESAHNPITFKGRIQSILAHEGRCWNDWKNNGCPAFVTLQTIQEQQSTLSNAKNGDDFNNIGINDDKNKVTYANYFERRIHGNVFCSQNKLALRSRFPTHYHTTTTTPINQHAKNVDNSCTTCVPFYEDLGNPDLNILWNFEPDNMKACASKNRNFKPELRTALAFSGFGNGQVNHYTTKNPGCDTLSRDWKILRLMSRETKHFFYPYFSAPAKQTPNTNPKNAISEFLETVAKRMKMDPPSEINVAGLPKPVTKSINSEIVQDMNVNEGTISKTPVQNLSNKLENNGPNKTTNVSSPKRLKTGE